MVMGGKIGLGLGGVLLVTGAAAQGIDLELTMRPIADPAARSQALELLEVPDVAAETARERSADGLARANERRRRAGDRAEARDTRAAGLAIAADARERGVAFGAEIAEGARGVRENLVRGGGGGFDLPIPVSLPELPAHVPSPREVTGPPVDLPNRPSLPGQAGPGG
jgi:hypothetical protein